MVGSKWEEVDYFPGAQQQKALRKRFEFADFATALSFTNKIGEVAEKAGHHPDIQLGWGYVQIWTTTHDAHGITDKDRSLAKLIDEIQ